MTSLIVFCSIAILSLLVVSIANQRDVHLRTRRSQLNKLKHRAEELETLIIHLGPLIENQDIQQQINEEIIDIYRVMLDLDSSLSYLESGLEAAEQRRDTLSQNQSSGPRRLLESDSKIALAQKYLSEAARVLRYRHAHHKLSSAEMQLFVRELSWQNLMVDVISMIGQAHKAAGASNLLSAQAFYKKARQMLIQSTHSDPRRQQFIREVAEILDGGRKSISAELMPESDFNPDSQQPDSDQILDDFLND